MKYDHIYADKDTENDEVRVYVDSDDRIIVEIIEGETQTCLAVELESEQAQKLLDALNRRFHGSAKIEYPPVIPAPQPVDPEQDKTWYPRTDPFYPPRLPGTSPFID